MRRPLLILLLLAVVTVAVGQPLSRKKINRLAERVMREFNVPGMAIAVIKDNRQVCLKGYGVRSIATGEKTDEHTLFAIASNTKAFTVATLGILIDEGAISWDTRVIDIIPEFRLYNAYVTEEFTIRDMLTHRSGMGEGAGDLMSWPDGASFTIGEIIHNLRYLKQVSPFRTKYDYDNLLYAVAGEVVARVSGMSWEEFVESRIMEPLGMNESSASFRRLKNPGNIIDAHVPVEGVLQVVPRQEAKIHNSVGGIYSSVSDMARWATLMLNRGSYGEAGEKRLFSEEVHSEMWKPQTIIRVSPGAPYHTNFAFYGLGWHLSDLNGWLQVHHTGSHSGIVTRVTLLPEMNLAIIVLTNQQETAAHEAVTRTIIDGYLGIKGIDRVAALKQKVLREQAEAREITGRVWATLNEAAAKAATAIDTASFTGTYRDDWFGEVFITSENGKIRFRADRSPALTGEMIHYTANTFVVRWDDRAMDADAFALFSLDREGRAESFTMEAISPLTDFSYDFHDLYLKKKR